MNKFFASAILIFLMGVTVPSFALTSVEYTKAGIDLYQQGLLEKAVQKLKAAIESDSGNWKAYQVLGYCFQQQNKLPEALNAYDQSLALHPDNPALRAAAGALRKKTVAVAAPPLPVIDGNASSVPPPPLPEISSSVSDAYSVALQQAQLKLRDNGVDPQEHRLLTDFYTAKVMEERSRAGLKIEGQKHPLTADEESVWRYDGPKSDFFNPHFTLDWGILTPTLINLDLGLFLDPTTNLGLAFFYVPLNYDEAQYTETYTYDPYYGYYYYESTYAGMFTIPRDIIYLEPRIKFYSAPSGLSTYHGFSFIYFGLHQGVEPDGYQETNFDIFGLGYLFGFRTLPMSGLTMELGWKMGIGVLFLSQQQYNYVYVGDGYNYAYTPGQTVIPFPFIIPEFRFGFTF